MRSKNSPVLPIQAFNLYVKQFSRHCLLRLIDSYELTSDLYIFSVGNIGVNNFFNMTGVLKNIYCYRAKVYFSSNLNEKLFGYASDPQECESAIKISGLLYHRFLSKFAYTFAWESICSCHNWFFDFCFLRILA